MHGMNWHGLNGMGSIDGIVHGTWSGRLEMQWKWNAALTLAGTGEGGDQPPAIFLEYLFLFTDRMSPFFL